MYGPLKALLRSEGHTVSEGDELQTSDHQALRDYFSHNGVPYDIGQELHHILTNLLGGITLVYNELVSILDFTTESVDAPVDTTEADAQAAADAAAQKAAEEAAAQKAADDAAALAAQQAADAAAKQEADAAAQKAADDAAALAAQQAADTQAAAVAADATIPAVQE